MNPAAGYFLTPPLPTRGGGFSAMTRWAATAGVTALAVVRGDTNTVDLEYFDHDKLGRFTR